MIERDADPLFFAPDNMTGHAEPVRGEHQGEMFGDANGPLTSLQYAMTCNVAFLDHEAKWYAKGLRNEARHDRTMGRILVVLRRMGGPKLIFC